MVTVFDSAASPPFPSVTRTKWCNHLPHSGVVHFIGLPAALLMAPLLMVHLYVRLSPSGSDALAVTS